MPEGIDSPKPDEAEKVGITRRDLLSALIGAGGGAVTAGAIGGLVILAKWDDVTEEAGRNAFEGFMAEAKQADLGELAESAVQQLIEEALRALEEVNPETAQQFIVDQAVRLGVTPQQLITATIAAEDSAGASTTTTQP
jgi:hypothetical protein